MANELAVLGDLPAASKYGDDDANLGVFTRKTTFHPRLKFYTNAAKVVKQKKFPENHYGLIVSKEETLDLGETFVAVPLGYRYKALDFREQGKVYSHYDPNSPEFRACKAEAEKKRPPGEMSGCMAGIEFLLSINVEGKGPVLGTILCSSASWKAVAGKLNGMMRKFVLFGSTLIDGKFTYQAPTVAHFSGSFDLGDLNVIKREVADFTAASGASVEKSEDDPEAAEATGTDRTR